MIKQRKRSDVSGCASWVKPWPVAMLERFESAACDGVEALRGEAAISCYDDGRVLSRTRSQCVAIARRFASYLVSNGVGEGDEVIVDAFPFVDIFSIWASILYSGAVAVFLPVDRTRRECASALRRANEKSRRPPVVVTMKRRVEEWIASAYGEDVGSLRAIVYVDDGTSESQDDAREFVPCASGALTIPLTSFERAIELCEPFVGSVHTAATVPIAVTYTQGTHADSRPVEIFNAVIDAEASEISNILEFDEHSSVFFDFPSIHTTTLAVWSAVMLAGASFAFVRPSSPPEGVVQDGYESIAGAIALFKPTHAFMRPHILGAFTRDIRSPNAGPIGNRWRFLSLQVGKFKSRNANRILACSYPVLRSAFTRPIKEKFFPGLKAVVSYGNHFVSKDAEVLNFLDLRAFNAYAIAECGIVHLHEFKSQGGFLKSIEWKIKNGNLFVRHKKVNSPFIDMRDLVFEDERCGLCTRLNSIIVLESGKSVDTSPIRDALRRQSIIDDAFIFGSGKPFLTALVYLNPRELQQTALRLKLPNAPFGVLAQTPAVYEHVLNIVQSCNLMRSPIEAVQKMAIIPKCIEEESHILTLSKMPRMESIRVRYAHILQSFYDDNF